MRRFRYAVFQHAVFLSLILVLLSFMLYRSSQHDIEEEIPSAPSITFSDRGTDIVRTIENPKFKLSWKSDRSQYSLEKVGEKLRLVENMERITGVWCDGEKEWSFLSPGGFYQYPQKKGELEGPLTLTSGEETAFFSGAVEVSESGAVTKTPFMVTHPRFSFSADQGYGDAKMKQLVGIGNVRWQSTREGNPVFSLSDTCLYSLDTRSILLLGDVQISQEGMGTLETEKMHVQLYEDKEPDIRAEGVVHGKIERNIDQLGEW